MTASAAQILDALSEARVALPTVVSETFDGATRLEWHGDDWIASIDLEADGEVDVVVNRVGHPSFIRTYSSEADAIADMGAIGRLL